MEDFFEEEGGWDLAQFPLPDTMLFDDGSLQPDNRSTASYDLDDALAPYTMGSVNMLNPSRPSQALLKRRQSSQRNSPSGIEQTDRRTILLAPIPTQRRKLRAISPDAAEKRRRQNRASQMAFRERSRKKTDDLCRELSASTKHNQQLYLTMKGFLYQIEVLKSTIEQALASFPPVNSESSDSTGADSHRWTPADSEGPQQTPGVVSA